MNTLIHTFSFEILLPHIVVIPPKFDIKISAIDVKSATPPKCFDLFLIPLVLVKFTSWQDIFSFPPEESATTFSDKPGLHKTLAEV